MNAVTQIFAVVAGVMHVGIWTLESLLFRSPTVQRMFLQSEQSAAAVRPWAFNQGFYNLFLAAGAIGGVVAYRMGEQSTGKALALFACASMAAAAVVLVGSERRLWRGAVGQAAAPLVALIAALF